MLTTTNNNSIEPKEDMNIMNNKDLLIVSLLEYICDINKVPPNMFKLVCNYLINHNVIKDIDVSTLESKKIKTMCQQLINKLTNAGNNAELKSGRKLDALTDIPEATTRDIPEATTRDILDATTRDMPEATTRDIPDATTRDMSEATTRNMREVTNSQLIGQSATMRDMRYVVATRYKSDFIETEKIGDGGFGTVFKAVNKIDECTYAIKKIIIKDLNKEGSKYYLNEVKILSELNHPNIVRYYTSWLDFEEDKKNKIEHSDEMNALALSGSFIEYKIQPTLYIQMELCSESLDKYIHHRNYHSDVIIIDNELIIFEQLIKAIKYVHKQNIIHGDISPNNVFLDKNMMVKLGDFGLAKKSDILDNNIDFGSYGNITYMAKEQLESNICNKKSDIYAMGIIYIELINKFLTNSHKINTIMNLKNNNYECLNVSDEHTEFIKIMIDDEYNTRANITQVKEFFKTKILIM